MKFKEIAKKVLEKVGGESNVSHVTHCVTRLRFNLKDESKVKLEELKEINGVMGAINKGGQFQVIIGNDVSEVYKELIALGNFKSNNKEEKGSGKFNILDTIAGIFTPIIPAIAAGGMLKAFLGLFVALGIISTEGQTYYIFNFISDAAFFFMPMLLAYTSAIKFKTSPYLAILMAGTLLHPNFTTLINAGEPVKFMGLPVILASYGSSVIPIVLIVLFMSYVERFANKIVPKSLKLIFVPLLVLVITAPIGLVAIGPLGFIIGAVLSKIIMAIESVAPWSIPLIIGGTTPILVMTGMHYSLYPVVFTQLTTFGYQTMIPGMFVANISQGAAALAVSIKSKDKDLKQLASSTGITALLGVTEPAMYGVNLRLKKPFYAVLVGGAIGGLYAGLTGVKGFGPGGTGLTGIAMYIGPEMSNLVNAIISIVIGFVVTFILTLILFKPEQPKKEVKEDKTLTSLKTKMSIMSPMEGRAVPLSEVNDITFAEEIMGKGIAIIPTNNEVVSPVNGTVEMVFNTKHAIGLKSEEGMEILIHIGLDTVKLEGEHFEVFVKAGDKISIGDKIARFDRKAIEDKGYDIITPVIVTNTLDYLEVIGKEKDSVNKGQEIITIL